MILVVVVFFPLSVEENSLDIHQVQSDKSAKSIHFKNLLDANLIKDVDSG